MDAPALQRRRPAAGPRSTDVDDAENWLELQRSWTALASDMHAAAGNDPAGPYSKLLLSRWEDLMRQTTAGDHELVHGLKSLYSDRINWPAGVQDAVLPLLDEHILGFLKRAVAARAC